MYKASFWGQPWKLIQVQAEAEQIVRSFLSPCTRINPFCHVQSVLVCHDSLVILLYSVSSLRPEDEAEAEAEDPPKADEAAAAVADATSPPN